MYVPIRLIKNSQSKRKSNNFLSKKEVMVMSM